MRLYIFCLMQRVSRFPLLSDSYKASIILQEVFYIQRYLLEVCQPDAGGVAAALGVLTRIARHSPEAARTIAECPRLCSFIINAYLPLFGWNVPQVVSGKLATSEGVPLALAMKFVRVLCQSSNSASVKLLVELKLERLIAVFLNLDPE